MDFGIFIEEARRGSGEAEWFRETFDLVDASEAWGLDGVWLGEIHFNPSRSVLSSPIALASFIAARTRRVRVGTAIQVLPLSNPLRIAEDVATVDQLSEGRFDEALQIIREAWKGRPFSYQGKFYRFENVTVGPRPYQLPHPPMRMAANSVETFPFVG